MNRDEAREVARIAQAYADGETVQFHSTNDGWRSYDPDFHRADVGDRAFQWRIKPKPLEFWGNVYPHDHIMVAHATAYRAREYATDGVLRVAVHFREVE